MTKMHTPTSTINPPIPIPTISPTSAPVAKPPFGGGGPRGSNGGVGGGGDDCEDSGVSGGGGELELELVLVAGAGSGDDIAREISGDVQCFDFVEVLVCTHVCLCSVRVKSRAVKRKDRHRSTVGVTYLAEEVEEEYGGPPPPRALIIEFRYNVVLALQISVDAVVYFLRFILTNIKEGLSVTGRYVRITKMQKIKSLPRANILCDETMRYESALELKDVDLNHPPIIIQK